MKEPMNMATKTVMVQQVGTSEEIQSCIDANGHWDEPLCDCVLLNHGFTPEVLGYEPSSPLWARDYNGTVFVAREQHTSGWVVTQQEE